MIKKLVIENIKKISFLELNVGDQSIVRLKGKNAQGKTSVLDAIEMSLKGQRALSDRPIRDGESSATIVIETEKFKVERRITKGKYGETKTQIFVYDKAGSLIKRPQEFLNSLFGDFILNPGELVHSSPKERINILKNAFGIDFTDLDKERARIFEERTERGRNEKLLTGQLQAYRELPEDLPEVRTTDEILKDISDVEVVFDRERDSQLLRDKERKEIMALDIELKDSYDEASQLSFSITKTKNEIERLSNLLVETRRRHGEKQKFIKEVLIPKKDKLEANMDKGYTVSDDDRKKMSKLKGELKKVSLQEKTLQEIKLRDSLYKDRENERNKIREIGREIDKIDREKKEILGRVKFPIDGMEFGETDITHNGIPFSNCSTAEQLKMSVAINAHVNNGIKIMKIEEGSMLDENSLKEIEKIAKDKEIQIWIEEVDRSDSGNVLIIEEGHLA